MAVYNGAGTHKALAMQQERRRRKFQVGSLVAQHILPKVERWSVDLCGLPLTKANKMGIHKREEQKREGKRRSEAMYIMRAQLGRVDRKRNQSLTLHKLPQTRKRA